MLLSFSVDAMRPMVVDGFRQYCGVDIGDFRVKRQTIRHLGVRGERLLAVKDPCAVMSLHLWWKSRTPARAFIGEVEKWTVSRAEIRHRPGIPVCIVDGLILGHAETRRFAIADGFNSCTEFAAYFVPNPGDVFNGVLYRW